MKHALKRLAEASHRLDSAMRNASALQRRRKAHHRARVLKTQRIDVTRAEFDRLLRALTDQAEMMTALRNEVEIQFRRTAEMQAALDRLTAEVDALATFPRPSHRQ
jgi:hypothetical protein